MDLRLKVISKQYDASAEDIRHWVYEERSLARKKSVRLLSWRERIGKRPIKLRS